MRTIKLYGVEHCYQDGRQTYEIFRNLKEVEYFLKMEDIWNDSHIPLFIFSADFNQEEVFAEDCGSLNYQDCFDTLLENYKIIKKLNDKPVSFEE